MYDKTMHSIFNQASNDNKLQNQSIAFNHSDTLNNFYKNTISSLSDDWRFYTTSIKVFKAFVKMSMKKGNIKNDRGTKITAALNTIEEEIRLGKINLFSMNCTSIHHCIQELLKNKVGNVAFDLFIGYSSYEHKATVTRIWMRDATDALSIAIDGLQSALLAKAENHIKNVIPSYIDHQVSQPISIAYHFIGYIQMLKRDKERMLDMRKRVNVLPIGSYLGAGSNFNISRKTIARELDFAHVGQHSMDNLISKDFLIEFASTISICATNISRLINNLIKWQEHSVDFIHLSKESLGPDHFSQEARFPKILGYIKSKVSSICAANANITTQLQEAEYQISHNLDSIEHIALSVYQDLFHILSITSALVDALSINKKKAKDKSHSIEGMAPDILGWLLQNTNLHYKSALNATKAIITKSKTESIKPSLIDIEDLQKIEPQITNDIYSVLIPLRCVVSRRNEGGSTPVIIKKMIKQFRKELHSV